MSETLHSTRLSPVVPNSCAEVCAQNPAEETLHHIPLYAPD